MDDNKITMDTRDTLQPGNQNDLVRIGGRSRCRASSSTESPVRVGRHHRPAYLRDRCVNTIPPPPRSYNRPQTLRGFFSVNLPRRRCATVRPSRRSDPPRADPTYAPRCTPKPQMKPRAGTATTASLPLNTSSAARCGSVNRYPRLAGRIRRSRRSRVTSRSQAGGPPARSDPRGRGSTTSPGIRSSSSEVRRVRWRGSSRAPSSSRARSTARARESGRRPGTRHGEREVVQAVAAPTRTSGGHLVERDGHVGCCLRKPSRKPDPKSPDTTSRRCAAHAAARRDALERAGRRLRSARLRLASYSSSA